MITKDYSVDNRGTMAKVSFALPDSLWATTIHLVGDFNGWDRASHQFRRGRDGQWTITVELEIGHVYQFRYLLDGRNWMNEEGADGFLTNRYGGENGLIITDPDFHPHTESDE